MRNRFLNIVNRKYNEIYNDVLRDSLFFNFYQFEGNAVGKVGEEFIKTLLQDTNLPCEVAIDETVHDEYDAIVNNNKVEIKTARYGVKKTFQFNGINPIYNYDFIFLFGVSNDELYYKIINRNQIRYVHNNQNWYVNINGTERQLVKMNPNNNVNYKLTLKLEDLEILDDNVIETLTNLLS